MKKCNKCKQPKDEKEFSFINKKENKLHSYCKACAKETDRLTYLRNKEKINERSKNANKLRCARNREFIFEYLSKNHCVNCKENNILVLEFNHLDIDKKIANISKMVHAGKSLKSIKDEINKCEVLCANCHRIYTAKQRKSFLYLKTLGLNA